MKSSAVGALILAAWFVGHHAYKLAPVSIEGHAWNVGGAASALLLIAAVVYLIRSPVVDVIAAWLAAEEFQAIGCTVAYLIKPWEMTPGEEKCSSGLGLPIQAACLIALLWCCAWFLDKQKGGK